VKADHQPQAAAAVTARHRRVDLAERQEEPVRPIGRDADAGVPDREPDPPVAVRDRHRHGDRAVLGELDRVAEQVDQDLPDPALVADHRRRAVGGEVGRQVQPLGVGGQRHQIDRPLDARVQRERPFVQGQLARLDLGEVQDVVDDHQ
jgi:hypothetical protein